MDIASVISFFWLRPYNRRLRTKSNLSLACLTTTDLVVGLVVQPLQISHNSFILKGETGRICGRQFKMTIAITSSCFVATLHHLVVLSAERYLAIKHSFAYENLVTKVRIIVASGLVWAVAIIFSIAYSIASQQTQNIS